MAGPEYDDVSSASQLSADLAAIDEASQNGAGAGTVYTISLRSKATLNETADLSAVNLKGSDQLVIQGNGATLDGGGAFRGLFVYSGTVSIADLTIQNAVAIGGNGGSNAGGGAGLGGGLFIAGTNNVDGSGNALATGGHVTLSNVNFQNNGAVGGNGSDTMGTSGAGGGGGLGGDGGRGKTGAGGGGGGIGRGANGGSPDGPGNAGIIVGGASGGSGVGVDSPPEAGGASGGGGGSGHISNSLVQGASGGGGVGGSDGRFVQSGNSGQSFAGNGGFGGGGASTGKGATASRGGFGGGGGGAGGKGVSGAGGFGGGGGGNASGGFGGGGGVSSSGGGGLGAGGDIFVQAGGTLTIASGTLGAGTVKGGGVSASSQGSAGAIAHTGRAFATGIYLQGASGTSSLTFDPGNGQVVTVDGAISDDAGSAATAGYTGPGSYTPGHAGVTVEGEGTLVLSGANTYTGATTLEDTSSLVGGAANSFSAASAFVVEKGTQVLLDYNQTIASLADGSNGGGMVTAGLGTATLTLAGSSTTSFSGTIVDGGALLGGMQPLTLIKQGTGTQTLAGVNSYSGGTTIKGGILDLAAAGAAGSVAITFQPASGGTAELDLETAAQNVGGTFANTLTDFNNAGEKLDLKSFAFGGTSIYNPSGNKLTITDAPGRSETFTLSDGATAYRASDDGHGGTLLETLCFASGTLIRMAWGDVPVENLVVGDLAVTASGRERPIAWISHRTIARPDTAVCPVRICAGAFGPDLPERDLLLSPGHPVLVGADEHGVGGHLVPIMCLVNGTTIDRATVDEVTYWHIELDGHDILLAEGLPAESYIDLGSRAWFAGADGALHDPDFAQADMPARCRPVATDCAVVEAERRRLDMLFATRLAGACVWPTEEHVHLWK